MVIDTYLLFGNNCTSKTCRALTVGGINIPSMTLPSEFFIILTITGFINKDMKYLKITSIIFTIGLLLQVYADFNLKVSYKYEVDLMETNIKTDNKTSVEEKSRRLREMNERALEIARQQKRTKILLWIFSLLLIINLIILLYIRYGVNNKK